MTFTDYLLDTVLVLLVVLQVRGRKLSLHTIITPLAIVGYVALDYLKTIPTAGNDLVLIGLCTVAGLGLGLGAGFTTKVFRNDKGDTIVKAGAAAAVLWVLGTGCRLAFSIYANNGGGASILHFSVSHSLSLSAWTTALVLMAIAEVVSRNAVVVTRAMRSGTFRFGSSATSRPAMIGARDQWS